MEIISLYKNGNNKKRADSFKVNSITIFSDLQNFFLIGIHSMQG